MSAAKKTLERAIALRAAADGTLRAAGAQLDELAEGVARTSQSLESDAGGSDSTQLQVRN